MIIICLKFTNTAQSRFDRAKILSLGYSSDHAYIMSLKFNRNSNKEFESKTNKFFFLMKMRWFIHVQRSYLNISNTNKNLVIDITENAIFNPFIMKISA